MRTLRYSLVALFVLSSLPSAYACGAERWAVKTLKDDGVGDINHTPYCCGCSRRG